MIGGTKLRAPSVTVWRFHTSLNLMVTTHEFMHTAPRGMPHNLYLDFSFGLFRLEIRVSLNQTIAC